MRASPELRAAFEAWPAGQKGLTKSRKTVWTALALYFETETELVTPNELKKFAKDNGIEVKGNWNQTLTELKRLGFAQEGLQRTCKVSGKTGMTWDLTDKLPGDGTEVERAASPNISAELAAQLLWRFRRWVDAGLKYAELAKDERFTDVIDPAFKDLAIEDVDLYLEWSLRDRARKVKLKKGQTEAKVLELPPPLRPEPPPPPPPPKPAKLAEPPPPAAPAELVSSNGAAVLL